MMWSLLMMLIGGATIISPMAISQSHRYPSAIIIGVKKCGTRALLEFLRLNPAVQAPGPEVHFFDRHFDRGFDWYRRQMPLTTADDQVTIEKSPSYFVTKSAPQRVHMLDPNMKLIIVVRNPITRAISDYTQTASKRADLPAFERMAMIVNNNGSASVNASWGAIRIGIYHRYVRRWLDYFRRDQLHFVDGERLISHPASEIHAVERFIGIEPIIDASYFRLNATDKRFPCVVKKRKRDNADITPVFEHLHCLGKTKGRIHPHVDGRVLSALRDFYQPENEQLYRLIGRRFDW